MEWIRREGPAAVTVVGVTADAKLDSLDGPVRPFIYVPLAQQFESRTKIVVRATGAGSAIPQVRALVRQLNVNLPVTEALPLSDVTALGVIPQRIAAAVSGSLGIVALLLAAIGIFGVASYAVTHRTREIGIRMALGADRSSVRRLVLRQAFTPTAIGLIAGLAIE